MGSLLLLKMLAQYFQKETALTATLGVTFGSMLLNYLFNESVSSHPLSFFMIISFFYYWLKTNRFEEPLDSFFGGLLAGLMCLIRWQHAIFLIPVGIMFLWKRHRIISLFSFAIGTFLMVVWQFIAWKILYGSFFYLPQGQEFFIPLTDVGTWAARIPLLLFSPNHGLFYWSPVLLLAFYGLFLFWWKSKELTIWWILLFLMSAIVNSVVWEYWAGWSFGARRMVEILPFLAFGLASLWDYSDKMSRLGKWITGGAIGWNILLLLQFIGRQISPTEALQFPSWIWGQFTGIQHLYKAVGQSAVFSNIYFGITENPIFFLHSLLIIVIYTSLFLLLIFGLSLFDRNETYV
jgi:hypothetical protein